MSITAARSKSRQSGVWLTGTVDAELSHETAPSERR